MKSNKKYIVVFILLLMFSTCAKRSGINNVFVQWLIENKNDILIYLVNEEATNELNGINHENRKKIYKGEEEFIGDYIIPDDNKLIDLLENTNNPQDTFYRYLILDEMKIQIGKNISKIKAEKDEIGFIVTCYLDNEGQKIFYEFTSNNINRDLAMVLNDKVIFHTTIKKPIKNSINFVISNDEVLNN